MNLLDLYNNLEFEKAEQPAAAVTDNTAFVSEIIDMKGMRSVLFAYIFAIADADATMTYLLEEGDDSSLSDNSAVADADMMGTEAEAATDEDDADSDGQVRVIGYFGSKRYVRLTITPAGNTGNIFGAGIAIKVPKLKPATQNP